MILKNTLTFISGFFFYINTQIRKFYLSSKLYNNKISKIDLIYSANTLSHIKDLNSVFNSIVHILSNNGVLIIEDPSLLECFKKVSYDQFYNEHIYIFSLLSIKYLLKRYNLEVFNIEKISTHGLT